MKKVLLCGSAAVALGFFATAASAADYADPVDSVRSMGPYVSVFAGASWLRDVDTDYNGTGYSVSTDTGYILGATIGMHVWNSLRAEIEVSHSSWDGNDYSTTGGATGTVDGDISATYLLGNLWWDFDTGTSFSPYIGGGAGVAWADGDTTFGGNTFGYGDGEAGFAFQLGAGVRFNMTENLGLDVGYRYKSIQNIDFDDSDGGGVYEKGDLNSHNLQVGLTFSF